MGASMMDEYTSPSVVYGAPYRNQRDARDVRGRDSREGKDGVYGRRGGGGGGVDSGGRYEFEAFGGAPLDRPLSMFDGSTPTNGSGE